MPLAFSKSSKQRPKASGSSCVSARPNTHVSLIDGHIEIRLKPPNMKRHAHSGVCNAKQRHSRHRIQPNLSGLHDCRRRCHGALEVREKNAQLSLGGHRWTTLALEKMLVLAEFSLIRHWEAHTSLACNLCYYEVVGTHAEQQRK